MQQALIQFTKTGVFSMYSFQTKQSSLKDEATQLLNEGVKESESGQFQEALETSQLEQIEKPLLHLRDISGQESNPPTVINPEPKKK
ncbi:hypothetical protein HW132_02645 [Brasilonema sp. CT11]|nr:hypothetical protein [Brasilonema sp. CT11]